MTSTQPRQTALSRVSPLWLTVGAAGAGFALSAALTALLPLSSRPPVAPWGALAVFLAGGIPLALLDLRTHRLPNRGVFPLAGALAGYWCAVAVVTGQWQLLLQATGSAIAITAIALLIGMIGTLAGGDIKLMLAIGLLTGWVSWMLPLYALAAGYLLAWPHAALRLWQRRRGLVDGTRIPFGPYLIGGAALLTVLALLFG